MARIPDKFRTGFAAQDAEGRFHCDDGPAVIGMEGNKEWFQHGELHREDGPAVIIVNKFSSHYPVGDYYFLCDHELSKELYEKVTQGPVEDLPQYLGMGFDEYIEKRLRGNT